MNLNELPDNLPIPTDDGAADGLVAKALPGIVLPATDGNRINLQNLSDIAVFYIYPMTGRPDTPLPDNWDEIPGARGCTPQSCGFRDHHEELRGYGANVFGVSVQNTDYQIEAKTRLDLPFELLSDTELQLKRVMGLPTFEANGVELYKRITLIVQYGVIQKCFYPIFPPGDNANDVIAWLKANT